jgi:hypothetical protein
MKLCSGCVVNVTERPGDLRAGWLFTETNEKNKIPGSHRLVHVLPYLSKKFE